MSDAKAASDSDRLTQWVREHGRAVLGFLLALVRDRDWAEELLQEVFCRAWEARGRYRDQARERAYLIRIADRLVRDRFRRRGREEQTIETEPPGREAPPDELLLWREQQQQLESALALLSEPQRRTLLLRYYGGLSFQEIAAALECPLNTVLSHGRRGLEALRRMLVEEKS